MGVIRLGCSGWDYRDWADVFYKTTEESKLNAYSRIFNTAEINSTFYSYPSQGIVYGWSKYTPPDFKFAVKLNRLITHEKRLDMSKGVGDDLNRFTDLMRPLQDAGKLACILIQLPPGMKFRKDRVEAFLKILPPDSRFALEYRNDTWLTDEAHELLSDYNVAAVTVWMSRCSRQRQDYFGYCLRPLAWEGRKDVVQLPLFEGRTCRLDTESRGDGAGGGCIRLFQ